MSGPVVIPAHPGTFILESVAYDSREELEEVGVNLAFTHAIKPVIAWEIVSPDEVAAVSVCGRITQFHLIGQDGRLYGSCGSSPVTREQWFEDCLNNSRERGRG